MVRTNCHVTFQWGREYGCNHSNSNYIINQPDFRIFSDEAILQNKNERLFVSRIGSIIINVQSTNFCTKASFRTHEESLDFEYYKFKFGILFYTTLFYVY